MALALPWDYAAGMAAAAAVSSVILARAPAPRLRGAATLLREAAIIISLYGLWQWAGGLSAMGVDDALARAETISRIEDWLPIPTVATMQHLVLWSDLLTQTANLYYAVVHFPATIALLIWMFVAHRDRHGRMRWTLALTTFACLAIQLVPVAPPRLTPGIVDTGIAFGQSVYGGGFGADELAAMPSVHVAWALAVGWYVWRNGSSSWRWIGPTHAVVTVLVVVVTGNHWWLDGVVAAAVLAASGAAVSALYRLADPDSGATAIAGPVGPAVHDPA